MNNSGLLIIGGIFIFPLQLFEAESVFTPEIVYTEPEKYPFTGNAWNSGKGVTLVLPDTGSGEWNTVPKDETTGVVGGVVNKDSDIAITVYAGSVSYELSVQGIYNYVKDNGFQEVAYVSCNGAEAVQFISGETSETNLAFPWNGEVIQITVKAADYETRNRYADWIFSSANIESGEEAHLFENRETGEVIQQTENVKTKIDSDIAYNAIYQYVDETLGVDTIYEYNGFITMDEETENEYVIMVRSYTGADGWYYVQKETGDVSVAWKSPITNELEERQYLFTIEL